MLPYSERNYEFRRKTNLRFDRRKIIIVIFFVVSDLRHRVLKQMMEPARLVIFFSH